MFGKKLTYKGFVIDISKRETYLFSNDLYKTGNLRMLITPLKKRLVLFENGNKIADPDKAKKIIDENYDQIRWKKIDLDLSSTDFLNG